MKKIVNSVVIAATALTLAACSGNTAPEPEAEPAATEEAAPVDDAAALEAATAGAEGTDPNNNPVPPAADAAAPAADAAAPAAE